MTEESVNELVTRFDDIQRKIASFDYAQALLTYDAQTIQPEAGAACCGEAMSTLASYQHDLLSGAETSELLAALSLYEDQLDQLHTDELRVFSRTYTEQEKIPAAMAADFQRLLTEAFPVWRRAKAENDYASWEPYVIRIVEAMQAQARCLDPDKAPYDVWLDQFGRGSSVEICDRFFQTVRSAVVPLVQAISDKGQPAVPAFATAEVPVAAQKELATKLCEVIGLDAARLTLGETEHPFTSGFSREDVRIAHHYHANDVLSGVFTTIHEGGHSLYEQNVDPRYTFTCLAGGTASDIHESQSRLMENMVGRSRPFMDVLLPLLREAAPDVYAGVTPDELYRAVNRVEPGLIRTESDELTYSLHIMVRYEVEKRLMAGEVSAHDAPALWNELMREYLGVEVPDDARGILQDTHWAMGYIGYFPSYALGNAYAAQFVAKLRAERQAQGADVDAAIAAGNVKPVTSWLAEHIWQFGKCKDSQQVIADACGEPFDPTYYTRYLTEKFSALYEL